MLPTGIQVVSRSDSDRPAGTRAMGCFHSSGVNAKRKE